VKRKEWCWLWFALLTILWLAACGGSNEPTPDRIATRVAEERAVAATLTADAALTPIPTATVAAPVPATNTPVPPTVAPTAAQPTSTPIIIESLPVDGKDGNLNLRGSLQRNEGRNVLLPGFTRPEVSNPLILRDRIALRVEVFDPAQGRSDGDGIESVTFNINDENGNPVHTNREESAPYCLFGGSDPLCTSYFFADHGYRWPNGAPITNGLHETAIIIQPVRGDSAIWVFRFRIEGINSPADEAPELVAELVQMGYGALDPRVTETLVFQVEAYDPAVGNEDGDGIRQVDFEIYDASGDRVYAKTENTAHYCAFGGGEPECNRFIFADNAYHWPNGAPIQNGTHQLVWTAHARDGRTTTGEWTIEIEGVP
jgi:hypothetical protein